jgi:GT2 family glycosyltransferase
MEEELEKAVGLKKLLLRFLAALIDYRGRGKVTNTGQVTGFAGITDVREVDHIQGCNMSFRKDLLEKAGSFDEAFGIGYPFRDDTDASVRIGKLGKILFVPEAKVYHKLSKTDPKFYRRNYYYRNYEHLVFVFKNRLVHGAGWLKFPVQQLTELFIYVALALREKNVGIFTATVKGKLAGLWAAAKL